MKVEVKATEVTVATTVAAVVVAAAPAAVVVVVAVVAVAAAAVTAAAGMGSSVTPRATLLPRAAITRKLLTSLRASLH